MTTLAERLVAECRRGEEDALYTAVTFLIWLRMLRWMRGLLWLLGAACGAAAASAAFKADAGHPMLVAAASLGAVGFPAMVKALKLDEAVAAYADAAARLSNLRAAARQAAGVWALEEESAFRDRAERVFEGIAAVRCMALTPPEACFWLARRKIKAGHYQHEATLASRGSGDA